MKLRKKLIEVSLPLEPINKASVRESFIYRGNPSAIHKWWAQRPLSAARAVIFAQMVDDPSSVTESFPTEEEQERERQRLFRLIEQLVTWENTTNEQVLSDVREEIRKSWRRACADNKDHPRAKELFNPDKLPSFYDPFAGGGSLPLEAQRLGLEAYASDLNPIAVLVTKAIIEIPPKFAGNPPVNPESHKQREFPNRRWHGAQGLAEDIRYYGRWMRDEAEQRIGHLYPKVQVTPELAKDRPDLKSLVGSRMTVIAWLWARTVKSPNPAFADVEVPLASTFMLSTRTGKEAYVEPVIEDHTYRFKVVAGVPKDAEAAKSGTKLARGANFKCVMSGTPITGDYIKSEGKAGRMGAKLMAIVAEGERGRVYVSPTPEMEMVALHARPDWGPEGAMVEDARAFTPSLYGIINWSDLFTPRQLATLGTFYGLVHDAREQVNRDALNPRVPDPLPLGAVDTSSYADAVATYLALTLSKVADYNCSLVPWYTKEDRPGHLFSKQAVPMVWDYVELNPFCDVGGALASSTKIVADALEGCYAIGIPGHAAQLDATGSQEHVGAVISTDPPYYDNVPYADLSDFFYAWLRRPLKPIFPDLFATLTVPKAEELVATAYRHGGKAGAEKFFLNGMTDAMHQLAHQAHPCFPVTIYYAFKQSENERGESTFSTGWDTFLGAVIRAGFAITGTWPMRTERSARSRGIGSNALASSIVLVCHARAENPPIATRRDFISLLKKELPTALAHFQRGNVAPVDLAQAAIGPGMAVYTRYSKVLDAEGKPLTVRDALALINQTLDEVLAEQEGDFDADTRWALAWFEQTGFEPGEYGVAETLSKAKNTSVQGMKDAGILDRKSPGGKVRLLRPSELASDWDPVRDPRLTVWEVVHHLVRRLESGGEAAAAELVSVLGGVAEVARELAYRLYTICERKKRAQEALSYNGLVQSWPEISRMAREHRPPQAAQAKIFQ